MTGRDDNNIERLAVRTANKQFAGDTLVCKRLQGQALIRRVSPGESL
jgi:hypothetical protein